MIYFTTKSDLKKIEEFSVAVREMWEIEKRFSEEYRIKLENETRGKEQYQRTVQRIATNKNPEYENKREKVSSTVREAIEIAMRHDVDAIFDTFPPKDVGGPVISIAIFESVLIDNSHGGIDKQIVIDTLSQLMAKCKNDLKKEIRCIVNPLCWIKSLFVFIIRIPFLILSISGFNINKLEDNFIAKSFKLGEVVFILYLLIKLGASNEELIAFIMRFI